MTDDGTVRDVRHVKAARELLRWNQPKLAEAAGLSLASVRRYEAARHRLGDGIEEAITAALRQAGIVFIGAGKDDGMKGAFGVALDRSSEPEPPKAKTTYAYGDGVKPGRPRGVRSQATVDSSAQSDR